MAFRVLALPICGSLLVVVILLAIVVPLLFTSAASQCKHPPTIFIFGDSNSDTGGLVAGLGFPINLPNGRTFFRRSTGRLSDGRLVIDFLCQSLKTNFLNPYLDSLGGSNFTNGANFAIVGSSTIPKFDPFSLNIQVMQFVRFKARTLELVSAGSTNMISEERFKNALYMIDIGQNDLSAAFATNLSDLQLTKRLPTVIREIENAVKAIHAQGGRKFWIHNTGPLGCLPQKLALIEQKDLDPHGCILRYNNAAKLFNEGLLETCQKLRSELTDATIVYVDIYSIKYDLIANSSKYGFSNPLMACCGHGGPPYNYDRNITCSEPGHEVCSEGSKFISWDGIHYTEAANTIVASKVLSKAYSSPSTAFDFFCQ
ncbi:hypothetical protein K2173_003965 [Erythroxylum novogranatense]|uniref:GDSL esterase/lipase At1g09390-like n=1 Tax=Erythroxylum novogranatense TaxID=1862640 RepID=A0AAV8SJZ6_9ROSI|nr:hypothetical protein K2173_003965 [Erythroxylum novogranatense]